MFRESGQVSPRPVPLEVYPGDAGVDGVRDATAMWGGATAEVAADTEGQRIHDVLVRLILSKHDVMLCPPEDASSQWAVVDRPAAGDVSLSP